MQNPALAPIRNLDRPVDIGDQEYWLDVAWRALQREDKTIVARIERGEIDAATVGDVVTAAARRVLRNPEGLTREESAIDDYREGWGKADATEDVYFTAAELRRLQSGDEPIVTGWSGSIGYC